MISRHAVVSSAIGLHARPAAEFVRAVSETGLPIRITKVTADGATSNRTSADARSLLEVMTADFQHDEQVQLSIEFPANQNAESIQEIDRQSLERKLEALVAILERQ